MAEFKITVGFDKDALDVLNRLAIALKDVKAPEAVPAKAKKAKPVEEPKTEEVKAEAETVIPFPAVQPDASSAPAVCPSEPVKAYTLEEIRSRVMALSRRSAETKAKVKEALNKYAASVPALKPDDYAAFMADLEGIE